MNKPEDRIKFHFLVDRFYFPKRNFLKAFLAKQLKKEGKKIDAINYIFCSDKYLLQMNQQYLNHDTLTDIITFELSSNGQPLLSDIYISIDRVRENVSVFETTFQCELHRVIIHGALHLSGYKDKSEEQARQMREKEDEWLNRYFVSRETLTKQD